MIEFTKTKIPQEIFEALEPLKTDDELVRKFGIEFGVKQCKDLIANGYKFIHFYTMNLERSVIEMINGLGICDKHKDLPFKKPSFKSRQKEEVRPIFWAIKPKSYIARTRDWDEFPNGRWSNSRSAAFELKDEEYMSASKRMSFNMAERKQVWGEKIECLDDIVKVFVSYLSGKIKKFPFAEGHLQPETNDILKPLITMNECKLLTINSQPRVNGASSTDPKYGWGPAKGYVF